MNLNKFVHSFKNTMPLPVTKGALRNAHLALKKALSVAKNTERPNPGVVEGTVARDWEEAWKDLGNAMEDVATLLRNTEAQGSSAKDVADTLTKARTLLEKEKERGKSIRDNAEAGTSGNAGRESRPPTQDKGKSDGRSKSKNRNPKQKGGTATVGGGSIKSGGSRDSQREKRRVDREEQDAELDAKIAQMLQAVEGLRAEKALLRKRQECDDRRSEINETRSQRSQSIPTSDEEDDEEEQAPKPVKKSKKKNKTKQKAKDPTAEWVAGAAAETAKKRNEEATAHESVIEVASTAGAAAAKAAIDRLGGEPKAKGPSLLELVKLLERLRPADKFDGIAKKVDFLVKKSLLYW